jgi:hypothetical protein
MAKGSIDPAFQAAPFLGESSHDPIEFTRRHNLAKYQQEKQRQEQIQKNTAEGLDKLMVDLKGWEDQKGFKEIMEDQDKVLNTFSDLSRKGMNLMNPRTSDEVMMSKAITDAHAKLKQKVDTWGRNKEAIDLITQMVKQNPEQFEIGATMDNIQKELNNNEIIARNLNLNKILVEKPKLTDMYEYVQKNKQRMPVLDTRTVDYTDETGVTRQKQETVWTPEKIAEARATAKQMYQEADESVKRSITLNHERIKKEDPNSTLAMATPEEYFIDSSLPEQAQKFSDKVKGTGGGGGLNFNFLGTQAKVTPGELHKNDNIYGGRNYNERYDFTATKTFKVPTAGGYQHDSDPNPAKGDDGWHEIKGGDDVEAELRFYDPKTDMLIFRSGQAAQNPWVQNNTTFAVPRKNVPDAEKLPIKVDGKMKTLKDILPKEETVTPKKLPLPTNFWSKPTKPYIPKSK